MTRNTIRDLNLHLFEQLERLNDENVDLEVEIKRSKAMTDISKQIIDIGKLEIEAYKVYDERDIKERPQELRLNG